MNYRNHALALLTIFTALTLLFVQGASAESIKERMLNRIPAINALKDKGVIGENNGGYLEYRSQNRPEEALVAAENRDRQTVYASIAAQQGVDASLVGQRRAKQIADKGTPGHWYQSPDGSWYKK